MSGPKECLKCGLLNPPGTRRCDCGYDLQEGPKECPKCGAVNPPGTRWCDCGHDLTWSQPGLDLPKGTRPIQKVTSGRWGTRPKL